MIHGDLGVCRVCRKNVIGIGETGTDRVGHAGNFSHPWLSYIDRSLWVDIFLCAQAPQSQVILRVLT